MFLRSFARRFGGMPVISMSESHAVAWSRAHSPTAPKPTRTPTMQSLGTLGNEVTARLGLRPVAEFTRSSLAAPRAQLHAIKQVQQAQRLQPSVTNVVGGGWWGSRSSESHASYWKGGDLGAVALPRARRDYLMPKSLGLSAEGHAGCAPLRRKP